MTLRLSFYTGEVPGNTGHIPTPPLPTEYSSHSVFLTPTALLPTSGPLRMLLLLPGMFLSAPHISNVTSSERPLAFNFPITQGSP